MTQTETERCGACQGEFATISEVFSHDCEATRGTTRLLVGAESARTFGEGNGSGAGRSSSTMASEAQVRFLIRLGMTETDAERRLSKEGASAEIERRLAAQKQADEAIVVPTADSVDALILDEFAGRKLEVTDVTPELRLFAQAWIKGMDYDHTTFAYLFQMCEHVQNAGRDLSIGQAKGVLNCYRAALLRSSKTTATGTPKAEITEGFWVLEGEVWKVQVARYGSGNLYAKKMDPEDRTPGGKARFVFVPGGLRKLAEGGAVKLTKETAVELGQLYGMCMVCGATLNKDESIEAGIGPVCAGRL